MLLIAVTAVINLHQSSSILPILSSGLFMGAGFEKSVHLHANFKPLPFLQMR